MDTIPLVESQIDAGRRLIDRLAERGFDVTAAGWISTPERSRWGLYLVSKPIDDLGFNRALEAMHPVIYETTPPLVDPLSLHFLGTTSSIAVDLIGLQRRLPEGDPWYHDGLLGSLAVQRAYVYPPRKAPDLPSGAVGTTPHGRPMTPEEVARKIIDLMSCAGPATPAGVFLRDGTSFQGVPFGVELNNGALQAKFVGAPPGLPRVVPVKDIATIE